MKIVRRLEELRRREHESTVSIVQALVECHRTKAHVDLGHASMWSFLVEHLRYSNGAASRRYKAMKCALVCPRVIEMLRKHRVNLSVLAQIEGQLSASDDPQALLDRVAGLSQTQVDRELARMRPRASKPREMVTREFVRGAERPASGELFAGSSASEVAPAADPSSAAERENASEARLVTSAAEVALVGAPTSAAEPRDEPPLPEERVTLRFSITAEQYAELERARAIVSRKTGAQPSLEECFVEMLAFYTKKKAAKKRSTKKRSAARTKTASTRLSDSVPVTPRADGASRCSRSRHIPQDVRDAVFLRDQHRCTYVGPDARRCSATHDLQLDHIQPFALGGAHAADNLRLLCGAHNRRREVVEGRRSADSGGSRIGEAGRASDRARRAGIVGDRIATEVGSPHGGEGATPHTSP